jgi:hypothetical protein
MKKTFFSGLLLAAALTSRAHFNYTTKLKQPDEKVLNNSLHHPRLVLLPL